MGCRRHLIRLGVHKCAVPVKLRLPARAAAVSPHQASLINESALPTCMNGSNTQRKGHEKSISKYN